LPSNLEGIEREKERESFLEEEKVSCCSRVANHKMAFRGMKT